MLKDTMICDRGVLQRVQSGQVLEVSQVTGSRLLRENEAESMKHMINIPVNQQPWD